MRETIIMEVETKQVIWYGCVQHTAEDRVNKKVLQWVYSLNKDLQEDPEVAGRMEFSEL